MESLESRIERLEYYQTLMLEAFADDKFHFYKVIMKAGLKKEEVRQIFNVCEEMSIEMKKQKAEGLVVFTPLLTRFVGMLPPQLEIEETILSLYLQGLFKELMSEFIEILQDL
ncbi:YhaI family protein [Bacillus timonensis]|nr:YhaI family protein [Bacillus timonensis]